MMHSSGMYKHTVMIMGILASLVSAAGSVWALELPPEVLSEMARVAGRSTDAIERSLEGSAASREDKTVAIENALNAVEAQLRPVSAEKPLQRATEAGPVFFVEKVQVPSCQLIPDDVLASLLQPFEGREQTMQSMQGLADKITLEYRKRGYISSQAYIPTQEMKDKTFTIAVLEGRIGHITFEGNAHYSSDVLKRYCDIKEGDFFSYQKLQHTVAKLNAHPDRIVRAIIRRGETPGQTDIIFKVEEQSLTSASVLADDHGSKPIGQNRVGVGFRQDNIFGQDDILRMGTMAGRDFGAGFVEHAFPIAIMNSVWKTGASFSKSAPQKQYKPYGISTTTMDYWGTLESRLITDETLALDWKTGLDIRESRTKFMSGTDSRERLRILRFGPALTLKDTWGATMFEDQFSLGLSGLGAAVFTASSQRTDVQPDFFASDFTINRMQKMPLHTRLSLQGRAHVSPDKQPSSEQMGLGGADSVRGYPEDDYSADQGVLVKAEYLVPFFFLPDAWKMPCTKDSLRDRFDFALFLDQGWGWLRSPVDGQKGSASLSGTGVGVRARLANNVYFTTDFAWAVGEKPEQSDHRFRIHSGLQANF